MMTSFVQIGDAHVAPGPRNADRYRALDQIIDEGRRVAGLGAWWWPGDVFDGLSTTDDRNAVDRRLLQMAAVAPVVIVYGNHDKKGDLEGFANLKGTFPIIVVSRAQVVRLALPAGGWLSAYCFPYPHKGGLVGAHVAHGDLVDTASDILEPVFVAAAAELQAARANGDLTTFLFHSNIAGAMTSVGQPNIGREIELTPRHLMHLGPIYKGGNHIHFPQAMFAQEMAEVWFAGSIAAKDYGEKEAKRYLVIHIAGDSSYTVESRPLNGLRMFHVEMHMDLDAAYMSDDVDEETSRRYDDNDWPSCDVRLRVSFNESQRDGLDFEPLKQKFASAGRFKFETVCIPDREVRSPAVAAARTLTDKLAAMRPEGTLPASVSSKVDLLEQRDGAEVLAEVAKALAAIEKGRREVVAA